VITVIGTILIVAACLVIGRYVDKKLRVKLEPDRVMVMVRRHDAGEAPATAIRARATQLTKLRATQRCKDCRALLVADGPDEELRYADRALLLLHFRCPTCVRKRSLYVEPAA
jgi:hypothetical protein